MAGRIEGTHELAQQERVAPGDVEAGPAQLVVRGPALAHDARAAVRGECGELEAFADVDERAERASLRRGLAGANRGDEQDRHVVEAPCEVEQPPERGGVAPVRVVDADEDRRALRQVCRHPIQAVQQRRRLERRGRSGGHEQRTREPGRARQHRAPLARAQPADRRIEQPAHHAVPELALELAAGRVEHDEPALSRAIACRLEDAALADPRRALHGKKAPRPCGDRAQRDGQPPELLLALHQRRSRG
ncbi:MAG TPA: hypothetical protein VKB54_15105 [Solirubrobacteraceae bacterium]|nr:hypothetical protein [Solirubrobacteraceae bacterium]